MNDVAIRATNLGKKYHIGEIRQPHGSLRESIMRAASGALAALKISKGINPRATERLDTFWALKNVSFEVRRGEVVGVIGKNGAGKSTLLKLLSQITEPTTGRAEIHGRVGSLLEVGTGFHPELSGRDNVYLNGAILGMRKAEIDRCFDEIVAFAEIDKFIDTPVKRYSSGMYLRLAFSVAAHLDPEILIVDEVLAVGDASFQKKCVGKMRAVARESGRTVVFVSHNMQAVKALCNRTVCLNGGTVAHSGPTDEVIRNYLAETSDTSGRWVNPATQASNSEGVLLVSVDLGDSAVSSGRYLSSSQISVNLTFNLESRLPGLCVGFDVLTSDGITVFRSYHTDQPERDWLEQVVGTQVWTCTVPAGLLNAGIYYISPRISIHSMSWLVVLESVLQFEVILDHGVSPLWNCLSKDNRPGVVAPILEWSTCAMDHRCSR